MSDLASKFDTNGLNDAQRDEAGQGLIEYALILVVIAVVILLIIHVVQTSPQWQLLISALSSI